MRTKAGRADLSKTGLSLPSFASLSRVLPPSKPARAAPPRPRTTARDGALRLLYCQLIGSAQITTPLHAISKIEPPIGAQATAIETT